jgi:hypothetical protein
LTSPADPTLNASDRAGGKYTSYAANTLLFTGTPLIAVAQDGTSNTIAFGEHYAYNCRSRSFLRYGPILLSLTFHRATFSDHRFLDVSPVTSGYPPTSVADQGGTMTFQAAPSIRDCDPRIPQTPHHAGMLTAIADGSVRVLAPNIAPTIFWGAVTPNKGEILDDW